MPSLPSASPTSRSEVRLTRIPILKALSSIRNGGAKTLLMVGQACVFYGAAEFSRDLDLLTLSAAPIAVP